MQNRNDVPPVGLGTLLRALLAQLEPAVEDAYSQCDPLMRSRYYPVLRALLLHDRSTVGDIAQAVGVSQPAITQTIRQMTDDGLLEVEPGEDRRARYVSLSARGGMTVMALRPVWAAVARAGVSLADDVDVDLIAVLQRTLTALEEKDFSQRISDAWGEVE